MAATTHHLAKPMSVKEIAAKAQDFEFNPFIALKYWLRTADTLLREASYFSRILTFAQMLTSDAGAYL